MITARWVACGKPWPGTEIVQSAMPSEADRAWSKDRHAFLARARGEEVGGTQEGKGANQGGGAAAAAGGFFGEMLTALSPSVEDVHKELQLENLRILAKAREQGGPRQLNFDI